MCLLRDGLFQARLMSQEQADQGALPGCPCMLTCQIPEDPLEDNSYSTTSLFLQLCSSLKCFGTGICRALHVASFLRISSIHNSMYDCTWVPGLFEIFLLGTRVCCSLGDGNVPEMMAMQQEAHEAATGNLMCQPPDFPSGAMLGAFPALANVSLTIPKAWIQPLPSSFILS